MFQTAAVCIWHVPAVHQDLADKLPDLIHEGFRFEIPFFHLKEFVFPVRSKVRAFDIFRHNRDKFHTVLRRQQFPSFPFDIAAAYKVLNDGSPGGRCPKALAFSFFIKISFSRIFHRGKQGIFRIGTRRLCKPFFIAALHAAYGHTLPQAVSKET